MSTLHYKGSHVVGGTTHSRHIDDEDDEMTMNDKNSEKVMITSHAEDQQQAQTMDEGERLKKIKEDIDYVFNPFRDLHSTITYREDGDVSLYTGECMEKRNSLRNNKSVLRSINEYIDSVFTFTPKEKEGQVLLRNNYFESMKIVGRILLGPGTSEDEIAMVLEEDWARDSKGKEYATREDIIDASYEMCDMWTPDIDERQ